MRSTGSADNRVAVLPFLNLSGDPKHAFTPRELIVYENDSIRLVGHTFFNFWRPDIVEVKVGERIERGLHLLQLLRRGPKRDIEILVLYPADGYWRAKPLPPAQLPDSAYGSSFLFGPVEEDGRPLVAIRALEFDPATQPLSGPGSPAFYGFAPPANKALTGPAGNSVLQELFGRARQECDDLRISFG
jgi:hypothetical protein